MELDVFLPKEKLALEYQGEQHFKDIYSMGVRQRRKEQDDEKRQACADRGITLVEVPFWWDQTKESLQNSIHCANNGLIGPTGDGAPIPKDPPEAFDANVMPLMLAEEWDQSVDVSGW